MRDEIGQALARGIVVIPVLIEKTPLPPQNWLPDDLRHLVLHQKHEISHERFGRDVSDLIDVIQSSKNANLPRRLDARSYTPVVAVGTLALAAVVAAGVIALSRLGSDPGLQSSPASDRTAINSATPVTAAPDGLSNRQFAEPAGKLLRTIAAHRVTTGPEGHSSGIHGVAFSPDGRTLISTGGDAESIKFWDVESGQQTKGLKETGPSNAVRFIGEGDVFATTDADQAIHVWNTKTGQLLNTLHGHPSGVFKLAASADGRRLASGGTGGAVRIWAMPTGELLHSIDILGEGPVGAVVGIAISADGSTVFTATQDDYIRCWDVMSGKLRWSTKVSSDADPTSAVWERALTLTADGGRLFTAGGDGIVKQWDPGTGRPMNASEGKHEAGVEELVASPEDRMVISAGEDGLIRVWDAVDLRAVRHMTHRENASIRALAVSPNGRMIVSGGDDGTLKFWSHDPVPN